MVNNTDIHPAPARRLLPGWDYWALTLLGAPLVASALALLVFDLLDVDDHAWIAIVACAVGGALVGWCAPSLRRLAPGLRALWISVSALLSLAIPVAVLFALLYAACHDGGCFS